MADILVKNQSFINGIYNEDSLEVISTIVETILVNGIVATKTVDKEVWDGNGVLNYTITIENNAEYNLLTPICTDTLDSLVELVADTVKVNGFLATYTYVGDLLTIEIPDEIAVGEKVEITFQVQKK